MPGAVNRVAQRKRADRKSVVGFVLPGKAVNAVGRLGFGCFAGALSEGRESGVFLGASPELHTA